MNIANESLEALEGLMQRMGDLPDAKRAYEAAVADLQAFLSTHQYFGEAAVLIAALALSQDEVPSSTSEQKEPK